MHPHFNRKGRDSSWNNYNDTGRTQSCVVWNHTWCTKATKTWTHMLGHICKTRRLCLKLYLAVIRYCSHSKKRNTSYELMTRAITLEWRSLTQSVNNCMLLTPPLSWSPPSSPPSPINPSTAPLCQDIISISLIPHSPSLLPRSDTFLIRKLSAWLIVWLADKQLLSRPIARALPDK